MLFNNVSAIFAFELMFKLFAFILEFIEFMFELIFSPLSSIVIRSSGLFIVSTDCPRLGALD